jgi:hypothetical protein
LTNDQLKNASKNLSTSLNITGDFSCFNTYKSLIVNKGTIKTITNLNIEVVTDDKKVIKLILGACSTIDGPSENMLFKIGAKLTWKGSKLNDGILLHTASLA